MRLKKEKIKDQYEKCKLRACVNAGILAFALSNTVYCSAKTDTSTVTKPLDNLKLLVLAGIGGYGVIILAKNVSEFAQAYQQQDTSGMHNGLKGILAGVLMTGISTVVAFIQGS